MDCKTRIALVPILTLLLTSCTFNPFTTDNKLTGTATGTGIGAGTSVGMAAMLGASKSKLIASGLVGAAVGYYVSSLRFASGGVIQGGGQVFTLGDYASIEIPTDRIFDTNSSDFLDDAGPVLDSAVAVLKRYPDDNIMVSGNTSGFGTTKFQLKLSEARARQVSAYLWAHGISLLQNQSNKPRKLTYTGYGSFFPIANDIHNDSIRQNSRIQITAYPTNAQLKLDKCQKVFNNVGDIDEARPTENTQQANTGNQFSEVLHEEPSSQDYKDAFKEGNVNNPVSPSAPGHSDYYKERGGNLKDEEVWGDYNNVAKAPQTAFGESVEKQGGAGGFKVNDSDFKDESR